MKVACCWSSGKDSCYACWKAISDGLDVRCLVSFVSTAGFGKNAFHGVRGELIQMQSEAMGIPMLQRETSWEGYEQSFREVLGKLRENGIEGLITGDIDLLEHRTWIENICNEFGIKALLPLWKLDRAEILQGFIDAGFESILVCLKEDSATPNWLGRTIDAKLMAEFQEYSRSHNFDIWGENGEYHTFVVNGPLFNKRIALTSGDKVLREGYWFQDIAKAQLTRKAVK